MPCLCPISIPDKVALAYGIPHASIVVPCGHCAGCASDRRNNWFVRIWSTYQRYCALGLPTWFVTITIDQQLWPGLTLSSPGVGDKITPFVRSWNERFRYLNGGVMPLRFICSEFGSEGREYIDKHGVPRVTTGALHFHGVIFGNLDIDTLTEGLAQTHGHVDFDPIRGPRGIRYVVKYCTKDYSIAEPALRARTFCSPGIGDSTYYFGDSEPTSHVLINGFHYRTPRYFVEKQWIHVYGRENFLDTSGRSAIVMANFHRRLRDYRNRCEALENERFLDPGYRAYLRSVREQSERRPATMDEVKVLLHLGKTGPSHPLLRQYERAEHFREYRRQMEQDVSFELRSISPPFIDQSNILQLNNYERYQTLFPLPFDFET